MLPQYRLYLPVILKAEPSFTSIVNLFEVLVRIPCKTTFIKCFPAGTSRVTVSKLDKFKNIIIQESVDGGNCLTYTGSVIGKKAHRELEQPAQKHGFIPFSNEFSVWASEELYNYYKET